MKTRHLIAILFAAVLTACHTSTSKIEDFGKIVYAPEYATGFEIRGAEGSASTLITVTDPWQGADSVSTQLFIARDGEDAPEGFEGQVLRGDARRVVAMSSTHIAMLDAVGAAPAVVGVSGIDYITNENIRQRRDSIGDVGYEGNINYELLLSLDPDIVLLYGVSGASSMEGKLRELGIPYMYVGDYVEQSPLGKAEWLVALSEIVGRRDTGEKVFAEIPVSYNALRDKVAAARLEKPSVMLNTPYNDSWFMPWMQSYTVRLIIDAGAAFVYDKNNGTASVPVDTEEAYLLASKADYWIDLGIAASLDDVRRMVPKFTDIPVFVRGNIYNNNRRTTPAGGNDYYESAVVHPDIVLRDLVKIFHPELVEDDFVYYHKLQ